ncbi:MAG: hypothetical protein WCK67_13470 [bacterium]
MPKVSVSLPQDILEFLDEQGKNRSKTIVTILEDYKKKKFEEKLASDYEEYSNLYEKNDEEWKDLEKAALTDLDNDNE